MTFKELYDTVIDDIDESIEDLELLEKIKKFVNRAYRELAKREKLETTKTITFTSNFATKPSDATDIIAVVVDGKAMRFELQGRKIYCEYEGLATLIYNYLPDTLESDYDETETNESNVEFILNYAKWLYFLTDGSYDDAKIYKAEVDGYRLTIDTSSNFYSGIDTVFGGDLFV